ncbi:hypothetical protein ONZ45_g1250 [Pleurotus djamor]|nr:hypothetical protein ONZ45_g1233 [Pleurotus djamor]KAJ8522196.1 hypothetical protein ONZ45_g1250 [Pleurotus djamor]
MRVASLGLLVSSLTPSFISESCISKNFYGLYNHGDGTTRSIYLGDADCFTTALVNAGDVVGAHELASNGENRLVWIHEEALDHTLKKHATIFSTELRTFVNQFMTTERSDQVPFGGSMPIDVLYISSSSALVSMDGELANQVDTFMPPSWKSTLLPSKPMSYYPVPDEAVERIKSIASMVKFDPDIAAIVNSISIPQMRADIRYLTGEDGKSGIESRHSFADGSRVAAAWLKETFESTGATCKFKQFLEGFAPDVICRYDATVNTTSTIVLGAHYDSRGSFGSTRAPGGDDDGSGTISLLSMARTILREGLKFSTNVELVAFAGEEQGLLGSRAYARQLRDEGANVTLMIQADMLAYHAPNEPLQLGLPDLIGTPEVAQLVANVSAIYSPELTVGYTPSFHEQGFAATQVFERAGPIADPMYHNSGDLSDRPGYDFDQVKAIAKVQFATLLHAAGYTKS